MVIKKKKKKADPSPTIALLRRGGGRVVRILVQLISNSENLEQETGGGSVQKVQSDQANRYNPGRRVVKNNRQTETENGLKLRR